VGKLVKVFYHMLKESAFYEDRTLISIVAGASSRSLPTGSRLQPLWLDRVVNLSLSGLGLIRIVHQLGAFDLG
jgi:hypothetical protein